MESSIFVAVAFGFIILGLPLLFLLGYLGWWLYKGAKRSSVKRGILACLLTWLVGGGILVNQWRERQAQTAALCQACEDADLARVRTLLAQGANPNESGAMFDNPRTPLVFAATSHWEKKEQQGTRAAIVTTLIRAGADARKDFPELIASGSLPVVKVLLASGVDLNVTNESNGETALIEVVKRGDLAKVKLLLAAGADMNKRSPYHGTPLHLSRLMIGYQDDKSVWQVIARTLREARAKDKPGYTIPH